MQGRSRRRIQVTRREHVSTTHAGSVALDIGHDAQEAENDQDGSLTEIGLSVPESELPNSVVLAESDSKGNEEYGEVMDLERFLCWGDPHFRVGLGGMDVSHSVQLP